MSPVTPSYVVHDVFVAMVDFQPDPSLGKYRSECEKFESAPEQSSEAKTFYQITDTRQESDDEVQPNIRGAIGGAAVAAPAVAHVVASTGAPAQIDVPPVLHGASEGLLFPTPLAPGPETLVEPKNLNFSEHNLQITQAQVQEDTSPRGVPAQDTVSRLMDETVTSLLVVSMRMGARSRVPTKIQ